MNNYCQGGTWVNMSMRKHDSGSLEEHLKNTDFQAQQLRFQMQKQVLGQLKFIFLLY